MILFQPSRVLFRFGVVVWSTSFLNGAVLSGRRREFRIPDEVYITKENMSTSSGKVISRWAVLPSKFSLGFISISSTFSARLVFFVFPFFLVCEAEDDSLFEGILFKPIELSGILISSWVNPCCFKSFSLKLFGAYNRAPVGVFIEIGA